MITRITIEKYKRAGKDLFITSVKGSPTPDEEIAIAKINEIVEKLSNNSDSSSKSDPPSPSRKRGSKQDYSRDSKYEI